MYRKIMGNSGNDEKIGKYGTEFEIIIFFLVFNVHVAVYGLVEKTKLNVST